MNLLLAHILRGAQLVLAIIVLGLAADGCAQFFEGYAPPQNAFLVFVAVWTILIVLYFMLAPRFFAPAAHPFARVAVDALTMIFWFAGFIAAADLAGRIGAYEPIDLGYDDAAWHHFYQVTAAAAGIGAIEWLLFVVTSIFTSLEAFRSGSSPAAKRHHAAANPEVQV